VAFIGPEQREMWRSGGGLLTASSGHFNVLVIGVAGSREEGKWRGWPLLEREEEEASLFQR
jgi:hypothetical protein